MSDDKNKQGADRRTVAADETYEVRHFADKHGISVDQAQELIARVGNRREDLDRAAEGLRSA